MLVAGVHRPIPFLPCQAEVGKYLPGLQTSWPGTAVTAFITVQGDNTWRGCHGGK